MCGLRKELVWGWEMGSAASGCSGCGSSHSSSTCSPPRRITSSPCSRLQCSATACSAAGRIRDYRMGQPRYARSRSPGPRSSGGAWTVQERWLLKGGRWMLGAQGGPCSPLRPSCPLLSHGHGRRGVTHRCYSGGGRQRCMLTTNLGFEMGR